MNSIISRECCFRTEGNQFEKVIWEITFVCSLRCPYCFQERTNHKNNLTRLELSNIREKVFSFLRYIKPKNVLISGGEPLTLGNELIKIIEDIKSIGSTFSISTTGFPQSRFWQVLKHNPSNVNISIDPLGMEGEQYQYRKTKFEILLATLQTISNNNIPIKGTSLITKENLRNVPEYLSMIVDLVDKIPSMKTLFITNPYHIGYLRPDMSVAPEEVDSFIDSTKKLSSLGLDIRFINFSSVAMPLQDCPAANSIITILPNGDIAGCPFLYQRTNSFAVGNVLENSPETLYENLTRFRGFVQQNMKKLQELTLECHNCPVIQQCNGGCFAETFAMKETSIPALLCRRTIESAKVRDESLLSIPLKVRYRLISGKPLTKFKQKTLSNSLERKMANLVQTYMKNTFSDIAHRYDHIECVVKLAKYIAAKEGANPRIVIPAAFFHDYAPRHHHAFHFHTDESADAAATFLNENGFDMEEITAIVHCIVASEFSSYLLGIEPRTLEAKVVRDADFLESIGARGVARAFSFAGKHCNSLGILDYDPSHPPFTHHNIMSPDETPIHHFAAKLLLIRNLLLTKTGKSLGNERHNFMIQFLRRYGSEMEGLE